MSTIEEIRARWEAATPGPWGWRGNRDAHDITLSALRSWSPIVMDFWRWGLQGARPIFRDRHRDLLYKPEFTRPPGHDHHPWLVDGIDHPDARFIAASWADVRDLLGEVDRLRMALGSLAGNPGAGFVFDEDMGDIVCLECGATGHPDGDPPPHMEGCPWALARAYALGADDAPAGVGGRS